MSFPSSPLFNIIRSIFRELQPSPGQTAIRDQASGIFQIKRQQIKFDDNKLIWLLFLLLPAVSMMCNIRLQGPCFCLSLYGPVSCHSPNGSQMAACLFKAHNQ